MNIAIARKPIFDTVRALVGRGFRPSEVTALDAAIDAAIAAVGRAAEPEGDHCLGALSERYESGGRGPGTVSTGAGDPGGVSYGLFQLASRTGTAAAFVAAEGAAWAEELVDAPGSAAFSAAWRAVAAREGERFAGAQRSFIARTHYRPVVAKVLAATGLDCDARSRALRDAVWSAAVQHGAAARLTIAAVGTADALAGREHPTYDAALIEALYDARTAYVRALAARSTGAAARTLLTVAEKRYPAERSAALAMLASA